MSGDDKELAIQILWVLIGNALWWLWLFPMYIRWAVQ